MQILLIILLVLAILINIFLAIRYMNEKKKSKNDNNKDTGLSLILEQVNELSRTVDRKLSESHRSLQESTRFQQESLRHQFSESTKLIKEVTEGLTKLDETNKQVVSFTDELKNFQDILKNPKQRGILGEFYLETLLKNVLPTGSFATQYEISLPEGKIIVDAVVFVKDKIIPVDSKFSLENYNRLVAEKNPAERERLEKLFKQDLKNRIDETAKYIRPEMGTMDFAFMFIPHEAIYYDLLVAEVGGIKTNTRDLIEYAFRDKRVLIVSPTSFLAFLQTVLQGLKALKIEETAKDIVKRVGELGKHLKVFEDFYSKMGNNLGTVVNQYNLAGKEFKKIDKDVMRITGESPDLAVPVLDGPENNLE